MISRVDRVALRDQDVADWRGVIDTNVTGTTYLLQKVAQQMKAAGKSLEIFRYDAEHAFVNEQRQSVHDRQAAELAWGRATEFFKKHLG